MKEKVCIMNRLDEIKQNLINQKPILKDNYKINLLGIFGSYVRGEQNQGSDLDILVDYEDTPSLITLIQIENELGELLGVKVDLVTFKGIKPQLKDIILDEVVYL
ncbi:MAG: hypothetical protein MAG581_02362 [Deltaproteobacteria bacterium]|nr:hypothetical protein [Deltaproteobacteria bacterium]